MVSILPSLVPPQAVAIDPVWTSWPGWRPKYWVNVGRNCLDDTALYLLTHWCRVTHICVGNLTIFGPDNGLSPGRRQAIIWTNAEILLIGHWGINFSGILIGIHTFSFKKIHLKLSSAKWRPFCLGLNVLILLNAGSRHGGGFVATVARYGDLWCRQCSDSRSLVKWRRLSNKFILCVIINFISPHRHINVGVEWRIQMPQLQWHHNGRHGVSNQQSHDGLLNRLFRCRSKKTAKLRATGHCAGNSPVNYLGFVILWVSVKLLP